MSTAHHILHNRREWTLRPEARKLRETPSLVPVLGYWAIHQELHANCPPVPCLGYNGLLAVYKEFKPTNDTFTSMDNLLFAIETASKHPKAHPVERELALLAMEAIDLQRPYIREGIVHGTAV